MTSPPGDLPSPPGDGIGAEPASVSAVAATGARSTRSWDPGFRVRVRVGVRVRVSVRVSVRVRGRVRGRVRVGG